MMRAAKFIKICGTRVSSVDPSDKKFGRIVKIGRGFRINISTHVVCQCDCGSILVVHASSLTTGNTTSCGCWSREVTAKRNATHGMRKTPEYAAWKQMKDRCLNSRNRNHLNYGGRGITVCDRWLESFEAFFSDMGPRPSPQHSIDRFPNNNGNYCPENCRWATRTEQNNNQRTNRILTIDGISRTIAEWSRISTVPASVTRRRIKAGWPPERAVFHSVRKLVRSSGESQ